MILPGRTRTSRAPQPDAFLCVPAASLSCADLAPGPSLPGVPAADADLPGVGRCPSREAACAPVVRAVLAVEYHRVFGELPDWATA